jgi:valyl-tRNA synthetase
MIESGFDILFFWIARMTMLCTYFAGNPPFKNILLHAMVCISQNCIFLVSGMKFCVSIKRVIVKVRDVQGRKMSKSLGNVIDPLDVINGVTLDNMKQALHESNLPHSEIKRSEVMLSKEYPQGIPACGTDALRFSLVNFTEHVGYLRSRIYITD